MQESALYSTYNWFKPTLVKSECFKFGQAWSTDDC